MSGPRDRRTWHVYLAAIGFVLMLIGIAGLFYSSYPKGLRKGANPVGGPGTLVEVEIPRSIRVSDSGVVKVRYQFTTPPELDSSGQLVFETVYETITITVQTPSFDTSPPSNEPISRRVKSGLPYEWTWVIRPKEEGQHYIVLNFGGVLGTLLAEVASALEVDDLPANAAIMDTQHLTDEQLAEYLAESDYAYDLVVPIQVVNLFGLTAQQAVIASFLVTFVGSGLTLPWVYEQWYKRKLDYPKKPGSRGRKRRK